VTVRNIGPIAVLILGLLMATPTSDTKAASMSDPLAGYRWRSRIAVIFGSEPNEARVAEQKQIVASMGSGAGERDLVVVEYLGDTAVARTMRAKLGAPGEGFHVVLVGKDGGAKLSSAQPIPAGKLVATIDAMPMRRQEMRRP
jgi:hypothetical protein